jgi:hypothetical protein
MCGWSGAFERGGAAFLHNVIIGLVDILYGGTNFNKPYNATLCKEALGKVFVAFTLSYRSDEFMGIQKLF